MRNPIGATACSALLAVACGGGGASGNGQGQVRLAAATRLTAQAAAALCGTRTLQPYSLDAAGDLTLAGAPATFRSNAASGTDAILGCEDNGAAGNNWGYVVTATGWNDCGNPAVSLAGVQPPVVSGNFPIHCGRGIDTPLPITIDVSIATPNDTGYIDIAVTVNSTTVQTGCKQADINAASGSLHFGESYIDPLGAIHGGLLGLNAGTPAQYAGSINPGAPSRDTFYTGQVGPGVIPSLLFQTFLDKCAAGEYADRSHAQCVTTYAGAGSAPVTSNALADVFLADPAWGYASATILADGSLQLYSSGGGGAQLMDASATPPVTGFNPVLRQVIAAPVAGRYTGIFLDLTTAHQFLVAGIDGAGAPWYSPLASIGGTWIAGTAAPLPSLAAQHCLGLFQAVSAQCVSPQRCK
jgi:hypothetical protein